MVTPAYNFALSLSFESSLQEYLSRAFAMQHNWKQAKYGEEEKKKVLWEATGRSSLSAF